jgi:hypothetical protein
MYCGRVAQHFAQQSCCKSFRQSIKTAAVMSTTAARDLAVIYTGAHHLLLLLLLLCT